MADLDLSLFVGPFVSALVGIAGVIAGIYAARRTGKAADGNVGVARQNADTTLLDSMRLGWESSMAEMRRTIVDNKAEAAEDARVLTERLDGEIAARRAILDHVTALELLIPFPPGPPPRPVWVF